MSDSDEEIFIDDEPSGSVNTHDVFGGRDNGDNISLNIRGRNYGLSKKQKGQKKLQAGKRVVYPTAIDESNVMKVANKLVADRNRLMVMVNGAKKDQAVANAVHSMLNVIQVLRTEFNQLKEENEGLEAAMEECSNALEHERQSKRKRLNVDARLTRLENAVFAEQSEKNLEKPLASDNHYAQKDDFGMKGRNKRLHASPEFKKPALPYHPRSTVPIEPRKYQPPKKRFHASAELDKKDKHPDTSIHDDPLKASSTNSSLPFDDSMNYSRVDSQTPASLSFVESRTPMAASFDPKIALIPYPGLTPMKIPSTFSPSFAVQSTSTPVGETVRMANPYSPYFPPPNSTSTPLNYYSSSRENNSSFMQDQSSIRRNSLDSSIQPTQKVTSSE